MLSREEKLNQRFEFSAINGRKIKDTFFGGAEKKAGKRQAKAAVLSGEELAKAAIEAGDIRAGGAREARDLFAGQAELTGKLGAPQVFSGIAASQKQAALSGALGPEAQAQAFQQFQEDPGTEFLRDQGLRLIESGAGAGGQLGGGNRLRELTKFSQGLALQNLSSRFGQLGDVSRTGLQGAQIFGGFAERAKFAEAQAIQQEAQARAGGVLGAGGARSGGIEGFAAAKGAGELGQAAGFREGLQGLGSVLSGGGGGGGGGVDPTQAAQVAQLVAVSDIRLKTNIKKTGEMKNSLGWYSWDWTEEGKKIAGDQIPEGVIAQEVQKVIPDAVIEVNGILKVDYGNQSLSQEISWLMA